MRGLLQDLASEQSAAGDTLREESVLVTLELSNGTTVTGLLQGTDEEIVSILRWTDSDVYADIPRHYRISAVTAAYYTEGS